MKFLLAFVLFWAVLFAYGQEKYLKKSKRYFDKGQYEKCISKTKKYLKKNRKSAELQYYIVASNLELYRFAKESKKYYKLKSTITQWVRLKKYNDAKSNNDFELMRAAIVVAIYQELDASLSKRSQLYLHHQLAEVFHDTTEFYREIYPTSQFIVEDKSIGPVYDSVFIEDETRRKIVIQARDVLGVNYKYGGEDTTGFDCSGFTKYVYQSVGIDLPHNAQLQSQLGEEVDLEDAQAGDLIFFGSGKRVAHAGMIYDNQNGEIELIHCASRGVTYQKSNDTNTLYWLQRVLIVKRFVFDMIDP